MREHRPDGFVAGNLHPWSKFEVAAGKRCGKKAVGKNPNAKISGRFVMTRIVQSEARFDEEKPYSWRSARPGLHNQTTDRQLGQSRCP
ncbi:hypothetical protein BDM02DRAFT_1696370 [Thelephora ganbajun]|uniref:Uncharacterized protein n=1 Tax=Thelephora ganbajun TaxID=370292 RepID=A0ACB6ZL80_THEGA|nr:hypothetical protein BDM02DRAFT_1696370 [Thelephora ganbajun]